MIVEAPPHRTWTKVIQAVIPRKDRKHRDGIWYFDIKWLEAVQVITRDYYVHVSVGRDATDSSPEGWRESYAEATRRLAAERDQQQTPARSDYNTLHLLDDAPVEVVRAAYKALVMIHHPDRGGDGEKFIEIDQAYKRLTASGAAE